MFYYKYLGWYGNRFFITKMDIMFYIRYKCKWDYGPSNWVCSHPSEEFAIYFFFFFGSQLSANFTIDILEEFISTYGWFKESWFKIAINFLRPYSSFDYI